MGGKGTWRGSVIWEVKVKNENKRESSKNRFYGCGTCALFCDSVVRIADAPG